jgi:hypothetical protein
MNHIPQAILKAARSFLSRVRFGTRSVSDPTSSTTARITSEQPQIIITNNITTQPRERTEVDEVELFLAEVRRSALTQPAPFPSIRARQEFISNLLITKRVVAISSSTGTQLKENEDDQILVIEEGDLESGIVAGAGSSTTQREEDDMQCAICLVGYRSDDLVCFSHNIKCNHHFHASCISHWLLQDRDDCPCCRNNYLALSDDEDDEDDRTEAGDDHQHEDENDESSSDEVRPTAPIEDDWIPSYLAPFYSTSRIVDPHFEPTIIDEHRNISTALSSRDVTTNVQVGRWTDDDDSETETGDHHRPEEDAWSCPSVEDSDEELIDVYPSRWRQQRRRMARSSARSREGARDEQSQSLELGDLILEGLMQRLQDRADERSIRTASSSSVYTEGTDAEAPRNEESELCAICRHEYAVNEELCWSQDPGCAHVFHRRCMEEWILENHDYCPFCIPQARESPMQPSTTTTPVSNHSQPQCSDEVNNVDSRNNKSNNTTAISTKGFDIAPVASSSEGSDELPTSCFEVNIDISAIGQS